MKLYLCTLVLIWDVVFWVMMLSGLVDQQEPVACIYRVGGVGSMFL
jgi:hypothetical protein